MAFYLYELFLICHKPHNSPPVEYLSVAHHETVYNAEAACKDWGGHLASVHSITENYQIERHVFENVSLNKPNQRKQITHTNMNTHTNTHTHRLRDFMQSHPSHTAYPKTAANCKFLKGFELG